jgi:hypothetical protein
MKLRQEINLIDKIYVSSAATAANFSARAQLDTTQYSGTVTYYIEVVAKGNSAGQGWLVRLNDGTTNFDISNGDFSITTSYARYRKQITPNAGANTFNGLVNGATSNNCSVKAVRILIFQDSTPLTSTETQIEIGNEETAKVNTTAAALTNPKYWYFDSSVWDGTLTCYAEMSWTYTGTGNGTVKLQEDDGSFGSWADKVTIVSAGTASSATRVRSASFTPITGRNYRIVTQNSSSMGSLGIYNAKIVVNQIEEGNKESLSVPSSGADFAIDGGTAGAQADQGKGQSFTTTSAYSLDRVDLLLYKLATPTDNLVLEILSTSITGSILGTSQNIAGTSLSTDSNGQWIKFTFTSPVSLSTATKYYLRLTRDGARDATNLYIWKGNTGAAYSGGEEYSKDNGTWAVGTGGFDLTFRTFASATPITKLEPQYLLANTATTTTGLNDFDTYFDPAEWSGVTNVYYHEQNASLNTSNTKLQQDPNGTPADITNSPVTGGSATAADSRKRSATALTMPGSAQTIDTNVVSA